MGDLKSKLIEWRVKTSSERKKMQITKLIKMIEMGCLRYVVWSLVYAARYNRDH